MIQDQNQPVAGAECPNEESAIKLIEQGHAVKVEGDHLVDEGNALVKRGLAIEAEGKRLLKEAQAHCEPLEIVINRLPFGPAQGVKHEMTVDELAHLVHLLGADAVVRRLLCGGDVSEPLQGVQKIHTNDQFIITRKRVDGGFVSRVEAELGILRANSQTADLVHSPVPYVIYRQVVMPGNKALDIVVPVPPGYPGAMIDRAGIPVEAVGIVEVRGAQQEIIHVDGRSWRLFSYHPHAGGGGMPWDPNRHGFHTYLSEILAWLEVGK